MLVDVGLSRRRSMMPSTHGLAQRVCLLWFISRCMCWSCCGLQSSSSSSWHDCMQSPSNVVNSDLSNMCFMVCCVLSWQGLIHEYFCKTWTLKQYSRDYVHWGCCHSCGRVMVSRHFSTCSRDGPVLISINIAVIFTEHMICVMWICPR